MKPKRAAGALLARAQALPAAHRRTRTLLAAAAAFACNLLYALYNGALGVAGGSPWFLAMCAFYGILAAMRFSAVLCGYRGGRAARADREYFVMALVGALLALLSLALAAAVCISLVQDVAVKHGEITMITIATYTFYKIGLAAAQAARRKKDPSPLFAALRGIRYAEVAASVLTLQRSMLVSFGGMSRQQARGMDLAAGAAVCTFVLALGLAMAGKGIKRGE